MTKKERKAIYAVEAQNLRLAHHLEGALRMLRDNLAALPDGAAGLIGKAEAVLVGQDDRESTPGNYAARVADLESENATLRRQLGTESARVATLKNLIHQTGKRYAALFDALVWHLEINHLLREVGTLYLPENGYWELREELLCSAKKLEQFINGEGENHDQD
jgi:hypothetical protein